MASLSPNGAAPLASWPAEKLDALAPAALEKAARARVEEAWQRCLEVHPGLPMPKVWFDLRGASAGQAHWGRGGLRFNRVLLSENRTAFFDEVIPHEMAHWLVFHLEGGLRLKPHGREWKTVMRGLFGLAPRVTHAFAVERAQPSPHRYRCGCREHHFTAQRHAQVKKGRRYRCRHCGEILEWQRDDAG